MAHAFSRDHVHLVFSTKERRPTIPKERQPQMWVGRLLCRPSGALYLFLAYSQHFPFTSFRASVVGYDISSLTGLFVRMESPATKSATMLK
jgi:hypothetical protein